MAEALTNVVKHAQATRAEVTAVVGDGTLRLEVRDDGIGGADPEGHGLLGIGDRVAALGGRLRIDSPRGGRHRPGRGAAADAAAWVTRRVLRQRSRRSDTPSLCIAR